MIYNANRGETIEKNKEYYLVGFIMSNSGKVIFNQPCVLGILRNNNYFYKKNKDGTYTTNSREIKYYYDGTSHRYFCDTKEEAIKKYNELILEYVHQYADIISALRKKIL